VNRLIKVLNKQFQTVAILQNAFGIGYNKGYNEIWSAAFSLPFNDHKKVHCQPLNYVEVFDESEYIGLFRIIPSLTRKDDSDNSITYQLEHVIATLLDDVLFQFHQLSNFTTEENIEYLLSEQTNPLWVLGRVDITRYFHYSWENENLLSALFSIPKPFDQQYQWTWNTQVIPWELSLIVPEENPSCEIRYAKNMIGIEIEEDPTVIFNRIYALGYGEGVNQLTISNVNPTGFPYVEDTESIEQYGVRSYIWVDKRFEDAATLYSSAMALLNDWKVPKVTLRSTAADISKITGSNIDKLRMGKIARLIHPELGVFDLRIMKESKSDLIGNPGDIALEIGNKTEDLSTTTMDLERRQQINELYSQGATNLDTYNFSDNCDSSYPAVIKFYIPEDTVRINKMILSYEVEPFRAYSRAIEGGGAVQTTTESGGAIVTSTESGGDNIVTTGDGGIDVISGLDTTLTAEGHTHDFYRVYGHKHNITVPSHTHGINIPTHTHEIEIPGHTHSIQYGIYEGPTPTSLSLEVDGTLVGSMGVSVDKIDIIPYLSKDSDGKITRGAWHVVKLYPNSLGRVVANIASQIFVQSRGGGDY
jgi:phage minor structural protein